MAEMKAQTPDDRAKQYIFAWRDTDMFIVGPPATPIPSKIQAEARATDKTETTHHGTVHDVRRCREPTKTATATRIHTKKMLAMLGNGYAKSAYHDWQAKLRRSNGNACQGNL